MRKEIRTARIAAVALAASIAGGIYSAAADEYIDIGVLSFDGAPDVAKTSPAPASKSASAPLVIETSMKVEAPAAAEKKEPIVYTSSVQSRVEAFRRAMVEADVDVLEALADEELNFGHSNGVVQSKREFIDMVRNGDEVFLTLDLGKKTMVRTGNLSVERHKFISDIIIEGKTISVELDVLEVWRNGPKGWQLIARQAFKT